jgi:ribosome-associated translation inhibitor RaiA
MSVPVTITYRGLDPSPSLDAQIGKCVDKLETAYDRIQSCHVVIELPRRRRHTNGQRFHVRVLLAVPGEDIVVSHDPGREDGHADAYVTIRDSFHAARRQLEDYVRRNLRAVA